MRALSRRVWQDNRGALWADRLTRIVNDILDMERLATGKMELTPGWTALAPLVTTAGEALEGSTKALPNTCVQPLKSPFSNPGSVSRFCAGHRDTTRARQATRILLIGKDLLTARVHAALIRI